MKRWFTTQEQNFLLALIFLLLTGLAVKAYRTAHPPGAGLVSAIQETPPEADLAP